MGPGELVGAALEAGEAEAGALVAAVAVFAAAGGDFIRANQERLKKTWVKARAGPGAASPHRRALHLPHPVPPNPDGRSIRSPNRA